MNPNNFINELTQLHHDTIIQWKQSTIQLNQIGILQFVEENHALNYQLWHAEDRARREDMGFEFVYRAKREIDENNQQRNNRMELIDEWLHHHLMPAKPEQCPVHSETPGMMIDRLSILALKQYHMALQINRTDVDDTHKQLCQDKLTKIQLQQQQLYQCLQDFLHEILNKTRTIKIYYQFYI